MASVYLAPGVYVEEFDSGPVPMAGGPTAVAAFVGFTEKIPPKTDADPTPDTAPRLVTSWTQYQKFYGGFGSGDWKLGHRPMLPQAVFGYFNNGGLTAYIVPLHWTEHRDAAKPQLELASTSYEDSKNEGERAKTYFGSNLAIGIPKAANEAETALGLATGTTLGEVAVSVETDPEVADSFGIRVRVNGKEELFIPKLTVANAAAEIKIAVREKAEDTEDARFAKLLVVDEELLAGTALAGMPKPGSYALVTPEPHPKKVEEADVLGELKDRSGIEALQIIDDATMLLVPDLYNMARQKKLRDIDPREKADTATAANDAIEAAAGAMRANEAALIGVKNAKQAVKGTAATLKQANDAAKKGPTADELEDDPAAQTALDTAATDAQTAADAAVAARTTADADLLAAETAAKTAQKAADKLMADYKVVADDWREVDLPMWKAVQTLMMNHCENQTHRLAILDPPPNMERADQMQQWRKNVAMYDSQPAALYYPWIKVSDLVEGGEMLVPPAGHMAGVWARTDDTRGVHKAPANEVVRGALGVQYDMTMGEQTILNPIGINAIRMFGTRGTRVWGARTLSSNNNWNYINVRRLFSWVEKTILDQTQWVVFEPNDQATWDRVTRTISNFLTGLWRDGALFGASPAEAFYVHCNAETNPFENREIGILTCVIGMAPVKPAEFVVFRVTQKKPE